MGRRTDLTNAPLVVLMDGPLSALWFHAADWHQQMVSAAHMRDDRHESPPQACLGYIKAVWMADPIKHPKWKGVTGEPWYYRDITRSQTPEEQSENPPDARRLA